MDKYVFGYGSLINLDSLAKTLCRDVHHSEILTARLNHHKRLWNLKESIYSELLACSVIGIFLNIEFSKKFYTNGVLISVSEKELDALSIRERKYAQIDVSDKVILTNGTKITNAQVFTFIASNKEFIQKKVENGCFVMSNYLAMVNQGCNEIGQDFLHEFNLTTKKNHFELLTGGYQFNK